MDEFLHNIAPYFLSIMVIAFGVIAVLMVVERFHIYLLNIKLKNIEIQKESADLNKVELTKQQLELNIKNAQSKLLEVQAEFMKSYIKKNQLDIQVIQHKQHKQANK